MAASCCICGRKIGAFSHPSQLVDGRGDLPICEECSSRKEYALMTDIPEENRVTAKNRNDAIAYFSARVADDSVSDEVKSILEDIAGITQEDKDRAAAEAAAAEERDRRYREERGSVIITTGYEIAGREIDRYCGIVSGTDTVGTGLVADAMSALSDLTGSNSDVLSSKAEQVKNRAIEDVRKKAIYADGDAVIGLSVDVYVIGGNMIGASAVGTAVKLK